MLSGRKEYPDEQLFARLIGAAVLLALSVLVLPFVLDGSGSQKEYDYAETLPVEPPRPLVEKSFSSRQAAAALPQAEAFDVRIPEATSLPAAGLGRPQEQPGNTVQQNVNSPVAVSAPSANNGTNTGGVHYMPLQTGWNIQVASFVRDENANKLVSRLRSQNLGAYTNLVKGKSRNMIRVLVGPYSNQIDALALQNQIDRDYRVESIVVRSK